MEPGNQKQNQIQQDVKSNIYNDDADTNLYIVASMQINQHFKYINNNILICIFEN